MTTFKHPTHVFLYSANDNYQSDDTPKQSKWTYLCCNHPQALLIVGALIATVIAIVLANALP